MRAEPGTSPRTGARLVGSFLLLLTTHGTAEADSAPDLSGSLARNAITAHFDSARTATETDPATSLRCALQGLTAARSLGDRRLEALGLQLAAEAYFQT